MSEALMSTGDRTTAEARPRFDALVATVLLTGCALRLIGYAQGHALWLDEAMLALNVIPAEMPDLTRQLPRYEQAAPLGFLFVSKLVGMAADYSEHSLRLLPLAAGLASVLLTYVVALPIVGRGTALLATALVAVSPLALRFSVEFKHYGVELAAALAGLWLWWHMAQGRCRGWSTLVFAAAGLLLITFSFTVIIVLCAAGVCILYLAFTERAAWRRYLGAGAVLACWAFGFLAYYFWFVQPATAAQFDVYGFYFDTGYVGARRSAWEEFIWHARTAARALREFLFHAAVIPSEISLGAAAAAAGFWVGGLPFLWRKSRSFVILLAATLALLYGLSVAGLFPLLPGRYLLFLLPFFALPFAAGVQQAAAWTRRHVASPASSWLVVALVIVALGLPAISGVYATVKPDIEQIRPLIALIRARPPDEPLVVYHYAQPTFEYYTRGESIPYIGRVDHPTGTGKNVEVHSNFAAYVASVMDALDDAKAAWILFAHVWRTGDEVHAWQTEEERMLAAFRQRGRVRLVQEQEGTALYRFERQATEAPPPRR